MNFPTPQDLLSYSSPTQSTFRDAPQDLSDEQQWEKFDDLFDKVFARPPDELSSPNSRPPLDPGHRKSKSLPGRFVNEEDSSSDDVVGDFSGAWKDALRRTHKTLTTTTKRRIIRHTPPPPALNTSPPSSKAAAASRRLFPKTPYPQSDEEDGSSDGGAPDTPSPSPSKFLTHVRQSSGSDEGHGILGATNPSSPNQVVRFRPPRVKSVSIACIC